MLTCKDFLNELNAYLDQDLEESLRREIELHLSECPNCWVITDTTRKTIQVYKGNTPHTVPEGVHARLMAALEKRRTGKGPGGSSSAP